MKNRFCNVFLYFSIYASSALSQATLKNSSIDIDGNCNVIVHGSSNNIELTCNNVAMKARAEIWKKINQIDAVQKYKEDSRKLDMVSQDLTDLLESTNKLQENDTEIAKIIRDKERGLSQLRNEQTKLESRVAGRISLVSNEIQALSKNIKFNEDQFYEALDKKSQEQEGKAHAVQSKLNSIEDRVEDLKYNVDLLMDEYVDGNLGAAVNFISLGIAGFHDGESFNSHSFVQFERLMPIFREFELLKRTSVIIEVGKLDWETDFHFRTLPGSPRQTFTDSNELTYLALGGKYYGPAITQNSRLYAGMIVGYTLEGDEETAIVSPFFGLELYSNNTKFGIDLRYNYFTEIETEERSFNIMGDSDVFSRIDDDQGGLSLGLKVDFRF